LRKLVQKKAAGRKIEVEKPEEKPSNVINLMDALRQSSAAKHAAVGHVPARPREVCLC